LARLGVRGTFSQPGPSRPAAAVRLARTLGGTNEPLSHFRSSMPTCGGRAALRYLNTVPSVAALLVVGLVGLFLVGLGTAALLKPVLAKSFLSGFVRTAGRHYLEMAIRLAAGIAFLRSAPHMPFPMPFLVFGWVLVLSTLVLSLIPWRWHQRFAQRSVPQAIAYLPVIGLVSLAVGLAILASTFSASAA
jgi:uncharacterized protein YjeT (DUF2065 family)